MSFYVDPLTNRYVYVPPPAGHWARTIYSSDSDVSLSPPPRPRRRHIDGVQEGGRSVRDTAIFVITAIFLVGVVVWIGNRGNRSALAVEEEEKCNCKCK